MILGRSLGFKNITSSTRSLFVIASIAMTMDSMANEDGIFRDWCDHVPWLVMTCNACDDYSSRFTDHVLIALLVLLVVLWT